MNSAPVVVLGLDSFDPDLATEWAAAGALPNLARLLAAGSRTPVRNPFGLPGAVWPSFNSSLEPVRHRTHSWSEIDVATYRWRITQPHNELYEPFWERIAETGRRVAAIDVPFGRAKPSAKAMQIFEWGTHDRHFGLHSSPPRRAAELEARFGLHPVFGVNAHAEWHYTPDDFLFRKGRYRTAREEEQLLDALLDGVRRKGDVLEALLAEQDWDLFIGVFSESHSVGHQLWHLHDPGHFRFDPGRRERLGDPVLKVYQALDAEVGRLAAAAGPHALVLVHLSHGMGVHYDGTDLLEELLERLDGHPSGEAGAAVRGAIKPLLPRLRDLAMRLRVPDKIRFAAASWLRGDQAGARARRRFFHEPNNTVFSGVRLNLVGREPQGTVRPEDADAVCATLAADLLDLVNVDTGRPVVKAVHRTADHHRREQDDCMPDLLIEWHRDAPIETVRSDKVGTVRTPCTRNRTGDHRTEGLLLAVGPGVEAGAQLPEIAVEDIGPSIAARFGVTLPGVDGKPGNWLSVAGAIPGSAPDPLTAAAPRSAATAHPASCG